METIILKPTTKKQSIAIIEFAKQNGITVEVAKTTVSLGKTKPIVKSKRVTQKEIMELSKKVNKAGTMKAFAKSKNQLILELSKEIKASMHNRLIKQYNEANDSNYR